MRSLCPIFVLGFAALWLAALVLFLIGAFGWFGSEPDPLSGLFLLPLGLPWNRLAGGLPQPLLPWIAALAPAVNLALLWMLCRGRKRFSA